MGLDHVEIVIEIEEAFGVKVPDEVAESMRTVGQTLDWLCTELRADQPGSCWMRREVERRLYTLVSEQLGVPVERIRPESRYAEDLGAD